MRQHFQRTVQARMPSVAGACCRPCRIYVASLARERFTVAGGM